ncbi:MAG: hypothetical protein JST00_06690 [Deltaproteobacteria bacterium]|nr:hypothetical protein [Deltaproteobacteria bacterium]
MVKWPKIVGVASVVIAVFAACGGTVTDVGSISRSDGGSASDGGGSPSDGASGGDALGDGATEADGGEHDGGACAPSTCGSKVCGRSDCGRICGTCPLPGGCFTGHCNATCPGTPCVDVDGHHICEGERGARSCAGGTQHIEVCTCSGGGANAWISCGGCL